jgi:hypothetical protein
MIIITKIKNSKKINKNLLNLISLIKNKIKSEKSYIYNTDWNLPLNYERKYLEYFYKIIKPYMSTIAFKLFSKKWIIHNGWFQQYSKSNIHTWHTHPTSQFSNVYFVSLPKKSLITEIFNHEKLDLEEGDLLTFPSFYYHKSPKNDSKKIKTIISFNSSFYDFNLQEHQ